MRKIILLVLVLAAIGGGIYGYKLWNDKPEPAASKAPDVSISAQAIYKSFLADENAANQRYNDKVVQVKGHVREIKKENGVTNVSLDTGDPLGSVVCEFNADAPELPSTDSVTIKGFCAGYNMDVILQRCSVVK